MHTCSDMRSVESDDSRLWCCVRSPKHSDTSAGSLGKHERRRKGPRSVPASSSAPVRTVAGSHAASAASAAASGFSRTIAISARYGGAKSRESETAPMSACSWAKSGAESSCNSSPSIRRATSLLRKAEGSAPSRPSSRSGRSSRSAPSFSTSGGCGNIEGLMSATEAYETHSSATYAYSSSWAGVGREMRERCSEQRWYEAMR